MVPINTTINTALYGIGIGYTPTNPFINVYSNRDPTPNDVNYPIQKRWINFLLVKEWILENFTNSTGVTLAHWVLLTNAAGGVIQFTGGVGTAGFPVDPDGTGHVLLSSSDSSIVITGNNIAHSIDFKIAGSGGVGVQQLTTDDPLVVTPAGSPGNINVIGNAVANASFSKPLFTHRTGATDTLILEIQAASQQGVGAIQNSGIASFLNTQFVVDPNTGFTRLIGGTTPPMLGLVPDAHTAPGTTPVVPNGLGDITITGAQVATGTIGANVIRTDSVAANTMTIEIQRTTAVAATDSTKNGVSHFDSGGFTVDANGFVQLKGGGVATIAFDVDAHTAPGTDPVVPNGSGVVTVTGSSTLAGTTPVRTDSLAANTFTIEVQKSQAIAATDATKVGLSNFDSTFFSVDANGFVSFIGTTPFNPNSTVQLVDDFISVFFDDVSGSIANLVSNYPWGTPSGNNFSLSNSLVESGHPGLLQTGGWGVGASPEIFYATLTGGVFPQTVIPAMILGGGTLTINWVFKIGTLSNGTNRYTLRMGMGDKSSTDQNNGCYFEYSDNINGGQWTYKTANGGVRTTTNSATAVTTGWHNAQITVNAAGTSISYVMDGVSLGAAITTNIPTVNKVAPFIQMVTNVGVTPLNVLLVDLFYLNQSLTTPR